MSTSPFSSLVAKSTVERRILSGTNALELLATPEGQELHKTSRGTWDPKDHPRGRNGRFIELGGIVDLPDGGEGRVTAISGDKVTIEDSTGKSRKFGADELSQKLDATDGENHTLADAPPPPKERIKEIDARIKEIDSEEKKDKVPKQKDGLQPYLEYVDRTQARWDERKQLATERDQLASQDGALPQAQPADAPAASAGAADGQVGQTADGHPISVTEDSQNPGTWWVDTAEGGVQENFPNEKQARDFAASLASSASAPAQAAAGDGASVRNKLEQAQLGDSVDLGNGYTATSADSGWDVHGPDGSLEAEGYDTSAVLRDFSNKAPDTSGGSGAADTSVSSAEANDLYSADPGGDSPFSIALGKLDDSQGDLTALTPQDLDALAEGVQDTNPELADKLRRLKGN